MQVQSWRIFCGLIYASAILADFFPLLCQAWPWGSQANLLFFQPCFLWDTWQRVQNTHFILWNATSCAILVNIIYLDVLSFCFPSWMMNFFKRGAWSFSTKWAQEKFALIAILSFLFCQGLVWHCLFLKSNIYHQ